MMDKLDVRIVELEPLHVAAALGWGAQPEEQAWKMITDWLHNQPQEAAHARYFGFNNPNPSAGSPNYGYEQWVTVSPAAQPDEQVQIKDFPGGLYAVLRCPGIPNPQIWGELVQWVESSKYHGAHHQWLEQALDPGKPLEEWEFDLYLPIAE